MGSHDTTDFGCKKLRLGRYKLKVVKPYEEINFNYVIVNKQVRPMCENPPSCFQGGNGEGNDRTPGSVGKVVVAVTISHLSVLIEGEERIIQMSISLLIEMKRSDLRSTPSSWQLKRDACAMS